MELDYNLSFGNTSATLSLKYLMYREIHSRTKVRFRFLHDGHAHKSCEEISPLKKKKSRTIEQRSLLAPGKPGDSFGGSGRPQDRYDVGGTTTTVFVVVS